MASETVITHSAPSKSTKRKLEDAFQNLDDAVGSFEAVERPTKRPHRTRSLYSTLAKYGIKTNNPKSNISSANDNVLSRKTPHLTAIIARAASHTRKAIPIKFSASASSNPPSQYSALEYRPSSISSFLSRLSTFKLATYANKPSAIDAVAASKCGWINDGKDRLICAICNVSWVVAGREGMNRDAANTLIEKQKVSLIDMHKNGCPWKTRQCDSSIYCVPLQSPAVMAKKIKSNAVALESSLKFVNVKHPLGPAQIQALRLALSSFSLPVFGSMGNNNSQETSSSVSTPQAEPSETSILTSLFGWELCPAASETKISSRPNSSLFRTASTSALLSPASISSSRSVTPTPSSPQPLMRMAGRRDSLLHCHLCNRRLGLWAFAPPSVVDKSTPLDDNGCNILPLQTTQRQLDILKEHRSYCPYVVKSTVVPSLPVHPPNGRSFSMPSSNGQSTLEGWRAVLTVVLRYGMGRRQRVGLGSVLDRQGTDSQSWTEPIDDVKAMVAGVKSRGGKDLLKYVQGLLR